MAVAIGLKKDSVENSGIFRRWAAVLAAGALLSAAIILAVPAVSSAFVEVGISVNVAPPPLPVYVQPICPGPGYIWTPGYWAWDPDFGYYWVPGTWVLAPFYGALWTPGYWGWSGGLFIWHPGYWGPVVGFYGGINYGFGYTGYGYVGGYWRGGAFYYNRVVNNVNVTIVRNVYSRRVVNVTRARVSYNRGPGGIALRPTTAQLSAARQRRSGPVSIQERHQRAARTDPRERVAVNHGRPAVAATPRPGVFTGRGVVRASRAPSYRRAPSGRGNPGGLYRREPGVRQQYGAPRLREQRPFAPGNRPLGPGPSNMNRGPRLSPGFEGPFRQPGGREAAPQRRGSRPEGGPGEESR